MGDRGMKPRFHGSQWNIEDVPDLPEPVRRELGQVSPDLPGLPSLGSAWIGIGQPWRQPGSETHVVTSTTPAR